MPGQPFTEELFVYATVIAGINNTYSALVAVHIFLHYPHLLIKDQVAQLLTSYLPKRLRPLRTVNTMQPYFYLLFITGQQGKGIAIGNAHYTPVNTFFLIGRCIVITSNDEA